MNRQQLFEFEDLPWFPDFLRVCMTRYINFIHKLFATANKMEASLSELLKETDQKKILDLCSGSGGPMLDLYSKLKKIDGFDDLELKLSDLYPNKAEAKKISKLGDQRLTYLLEPVDATTPNEKHEGVRTMISSFHHMPVSVAKSILQSASDSRQPIFIYEMTDNSLPHAAHWITLPIGALMVLLFTPFVRPLSLTQIIFTYIVPILPLVIAWDAAVSNVRTYSPADLEELLAEIPIHGYSWHKMILGGRGGNSLVLIGKPTKAV
ncbi:MAG: hypothetical protein ACOH5I_15395 [Oligoflexus sp.]